MGGGRHGRLRVASLGCAAALAPDVQCCSCVHVIACPASGSRKQDAPVGAARGTGGLGIRIRTCWRRVALHGRRRTLRGCGRRRWLCSLHRLGAVHLGPLGLCRITAWNAVSFEGSDMWHDVSAGAAADEMHTNSGKTDCSQQLQLCHSASEAAGLRSPTCSHAASAKLEQRRGCRRCRPPGCLTLTTSFLGHCSACRHRIAARRILSLHAHGQALSAFSPRAATVLASNLNRGVDVGDGDRHERLKLAFGSGATGVLGCCCSLLPSSSCSTCSGNASTHS